MELQDKKSRAVANWLILGVAMTIVQIALGGITRLTGSGLSITEWDVVTGTLPPLNQAAWLALFEKYKTTPQFQLLNFDFTIDNFKFLGMVPPFVGTYHWLGICFWVYLFYCKKIFSTCNDSSFGGFIFIRGIARCNWLDHGG
jgi:hypothetical protein